MKPHDGSEAEKQRLVSEWFGKAGEDLRAAECLFAASQFNVMAFHCQQAVEKSIKALLVMRQVDSPKTHDLDRLLDLVAGFDASLAESLRDVIVLTTYGVGARYPFEMQAVDAEEASEALALARRALAAVSEKI